MVGEVCSGAMLKRGAYSEMPADSDLAKLKSSCDAAAHSYELLLVLPDNKYGNCNRTSNYS
jgi:hypothetical protein